MPLEVETGDGVVGLGLKPDGLDAPFRGGAKTGHAPALQEVGDQRGDEDRLARPAEPGDAKPQHRVRQTQARDHVAADAHCPMSFLFLPQRPGWQDRSGPLRLPVTPHCARGGGAAMSGPCHVTICPSMPSCPSFAPPLPARVARCWSHRPAPARRPACRWRCWTRCRAGSSCWSRAALPPAPPPSGWPRPWASPWAGASATASGAKACRAAGSRL